jgi:inner membrane transporter RhtA
MTQTGRASNAGRQRVIAGAAMIVGTSLSIQLAAAVAHDLFASLGPAGASAIRFALGAIVLFVLVRPAIRGRDRATWVAIVAYGASLAALNITFFQAISRIPLGIADTLAFIGPLAVALVGSRRRRDIVWALLAGAGVATLGGFDRPGSVIGVLFAIGAGCSWVGVAYAARIVGRRTRGVDGLALAIPIAALITVPLGIGRVGALDPHSLAIGLVIAIGGLIVPFALELEGLRRLEPRIVAVIYSVDPAIAAIVGFVALGEHLSMFQVLALIAVVIASAGATAAADVTDRHGHVPPIPDVMIGAISSRLPERAPASAPPQLQALWPLVLKFGESDDVARERVLESLSADELQELVDRVDRAALVAINEYLDETGDSEESVPYGDLAQAAMEAALLLKSRQA